MKTSNSSTVVFGSAAWKILRSVKLQGHARLILIAREKNSWKGEMMSPKILFSPSIDAWPRVVAEGGFKFLQRLLNAITPANGWVLAEALQSGADFSEATIQAVNAGWSKMEILQGKEDPWKKGMREVLKKHCPNLSGGFYYLSCVEDIGVPVDVLDSVCGGHCSLVSVSQFLASSEYRNFMNIGGSADGFNFGFTTFGGSRVISLAGSMFSRSLSPEKLDEILGKVLKTLEDSFQRYLQNLTNEDSPRSETKSPLASLYFGEGYIPPFDEEATED